jgi:hypothetical protein
MVYTNNKHEVPSEKPTEQKTDIQTQLSNLKAQIEGEQNAEKRKELQRRLVRLERFDKIKNESVNPYKEDIWKVLKNKDADSMKSSDLLTLRKKWVDIASLTLVNEANPLSEVSSHSIQAGEKFIVNFWENKGLKDRIWAWDILPPEIKTIKINGVTCERKNTPRPWYYNEKWVYQPIYDAYKIEIMWLGQSNKDDAEANEKQWKNERLEDMMENWWKPLTDIKDDADLESLAKEEFNMRQKYWTINFNINEIGSWDRGLLNFIGIAEWTWENYNAIYANGKQNREKFTEMTLNEILSYQANYKTSYGSAAIGRYQFMDYTLKDMMNKYQISGDTIFSPEFQDKLAFLKLNERWLLSFKSWRISKDVFQMNLSREWASIAKDESWLSYYHGDTMNNHASSAWRQVSRVLDTLYQA